MSILETPKSSREEVLKDLEEQMIFWFNSSVRAYRGLPPITSHGHPMIGYPPFDREGFREVWSFDIEEYAKLGEEGRRDFVREYMKVI